MAFFFFLIANNKFVCFIEYVMWREGAGTIFCSINFCCFRLKLLKEQTIHTTLVKFQKKKKNQKLALAGEQAGRQAKFVNLSIIKISLDLWY